MSEVQHLRRSQWRVIHRCLDILVRLIKSPVTGEELLEIIYTEAATEGQILSKSDAAKRFEEDRHRLRISFGVEIDYLRANDEYVLRSIGRPLADLSETNQEAFAFLEQTFQDSSLPLSQAIQEFLQLVKGLLPKSTQADLYKKRNLLEVEWNVRDKDLIPQNTLDVIQTTCSEKRLLEFDYFSPQSQDNQPRHHRVEPYRYFFNAERGHYYLEAYCIERKDAQTFSYPSKLTIYRLGRIHNPKALPQHFIQRRIPEYPLDYVLSSTVARLGVSEHFAKMQVFPNADGSVLVKAVSHNLFFDLRTLLHYGGNCQVVGGEEAVSEMKVIVQGLYQRYFGA